MAKKVIVVDDEHDIRRFLTVLLNKAGYETVEAEDGAKALEIVVQEKPDLIILDLQMPHKTGTDFYRKLAKDEHLGKIPVIVVSGIPGRHLAIKKPVAVFDKPIDPEKFLAKVEEALS